MTRRGAPPVPISLDVPVIGAAAAAQHIDVRVLPRQIMLYREFVRAVFLGS